MQDFEKTLKNQYINEIKIVKKKANSLSTKVALLGGVLFSCFFSFTERITEEKLARRLRDIQYE